MSCVNSIIGMIPTSEPRQKLQWRMVILKVAKVSNITVIVFQKLRLQMHQWLNFRVFFCSWMYSCTLEWHQSEDIISCTHPLVKPPVCKWQREEIYFNGIVALKRRGSKMAWFRQVVNLHCCRPLELSPRPKIWSWNELNRSQTSQYLSVMLLVDCVCPLQFCNLHWYI